MAVQKTLRDAWIRFSTQYSHDLTGGRDRYGLNSQLKNFREPKNNITIRGIQQNTMIGMIHKGFFGSKYNINKNHLPCDRMSTHLR